MRTPLRPSSLLVVLLALATAPSLRAQTTFTVTVEAESNHPWEDAYFQVYVIDGTQGQTLTLVRGETYVFQLQNLSGHPFYISTNSSGGGAGLYGGLAPQENGTFTFTVPMDAPDLLYYQCSYHPRMGGEINIVSGGGTAAERPDVPNSIRLDQNYPNPFNPETGISFAIEASETVRLAVFDLQGRTIRILVSGTLPAGEHSAVWDGTTADGSDAPSGTYFYRLETADETLTRSMTLIR